jgi:protein involved in polysaccharide export with SLBB domain
MHKQILTLLFACLISLTSISVWADPTEPVSSEAAVSPLQVNLNAVYDSYFARKYRLGPNDALSISVFDTPEYNLENITVQPDGKIVVAPLGVLHVAGMTIDELHGMLVDKYKYYLNDPQLTIKLEHTKPFSVYMSGAVLHPGSYEIVTDPLRNFSRSGSNSDITLERKSPLLSNMLVAAGGLTHDADLEHVKVENRIDGTKFEVNLLELIANGASGNDLYLIAGDSIHVPRLASHEISEEKYKLALGSTVFQKTIPVKVYGYVNEPGLVQLESAQSANINSAIVAAGGYLTDSAYAPSKVIVYRSEKGGSLKTMEVDPRKEDITLMPNDMVYVPEKTRPLIGKAFDFMGRIISPIAGIGSAYNNWALMFNPTRFRVNVN